MWKGSPQSRCVCVVRDLCSITITVSCNASLVKYKTDCSSGYLVGVLGEDGHVVVYIQHLNQDLGRGLVEGVRGPHHQPVHRLLLTVQHLRQGHHACVAIDGEAPSGLALSEKL